MSETFGDCIMTTCRDPETGQISLTIDQADPRILISPELLDKWEDRPDFPASFDGKVLRIYGTNRTVIYRIRDVLEPVPGHLGYWNYVGEWPD